MKFPSSGLYAITQTEGKTCEIIIQEVNSAILGGACVIQYRDKQNSPTEILNCATKLKALCKHHNIPLIINDNIELAFKIKANGVHIGKHDGTIALARKRLGEKAIIGLSCYNDISKAKKAESEGADYVAFGRFFPSNSKPLALPANKATLISAKKILHIPIVVIGGILPENGQQLLDSGADVLAVIGGIFDDAPEESARNYLKLFND